MMKMLKRNQIVALLLAVIALFTLSACGGQPSGNYGYPYQKNAENAAAGEEDAPLQETSEPPEEVDPAVEHFLTAIDHVEQRVDGSDLTIQVYLTPEWEGKLQLAWYLNLVGEHEPLIKDYYEEETIHTFPGLEPGEYQVKYFLRDNDFKKSYLAPPITVEAPGTDNAAAEGADAEN